MNWSPIRIRPVRGPDELAATENDIVPVPRPGGERSWIHASPVEGVHVHAVPVAVTSTPKRPPSALTSRTGGDSLNEHPSCVTLAIAEPTRIVPLRDNASLAATV
jgi:hypothetical protein